MRSTCRAVLLIAIAALIAASPALSRAAQPESSRPAFPLGKLEAALKESIEKKRILVVFLNRPGHAWDLVEEKTLTNRTLEAWILWHGVGLNLDEREDPGGHAAVIRAIARSRQSGAGAVGLGPDVFPTFLFFMDGKLVRTYPDADFHGFLGAGDRDVFYPKATQILFTADFLMEKLASTEPVWMMMHKELNPPPQPPPPQPPLCFADDGDIPGVPDPMPGEDLLAILERARDAVRIGGLNQATGLYSWLWERSAEVDPAFRALRRSFLLPEIAELCRRDPKAAKRFEAHRQRLGDRFLWWEFIEWVDWMAMNETLGIEGENLKLLATPLLDEQEATMLPRADYAAFQTMLGLGDFTLPERVTVGQFEAFRTLCARTRAPRPLSAPGEEWAALIEFRKQLAVDEGSRIHAALLLKGKQTEAAEVARLVLANADHPGTARLSLVITALAAGVEPTPQFEQWVNEAADHGEPRPWLLNRLRSR